MVYLHKLKGFFYDFSNFVLKCMLLSGYTKAFNIDMVILTQNMYSIVEKDALCYSEGHNQSQLKA